MDEQIFFQDRLLTVTNARIAVSEGTTYETATVTGVRILVQSKSLFGLVAGLLLGGIGLLFLTWNARSWGGALLALGALCVFGYTRGHDKLWVLVATAGVEKAAVCSIDPKWAQAVADAVQKAIAGRAEHTSTPVQ
jgi:hypothetical protein